MRPTKTFLSAVVLGIGLMQMAACAYQLRRGSLGLGGLGEGVESARVFVPIVDNMGTEVGPESVLTGAVRESLATLQGLDVVNSEGKANFILLGRVKDWGRSVVSNSSLSTAAAENRGGMIRNQFSAADIKVYMVADFELLEVRASSGDLPVRRRLWTRQFRTEGNYEASALFDEFSGSSSAPHINQSRERLQLRRISETMARQIIDQVSQDF